MANCTYCKRPAGLLRSSHSACKQAHDAGMRAIANLVGRSDLSPEESAEQILQTAEQARITETLRQALADGWVTAVEAALAKDGVGEAEETRLDVLLSRFDFARKDVDAGHLWRRVEAKRAQAAADQVELRIRDAVDGGEHSDGAMAELQASIEGAVRSARLGEADARQVVIAAVEKEIERVVENESLTEAKETALSTVFSHFDIGQDDLDRNGAFTRLVQAFILRDVKEGDVRRRVHCDTPELPFRLQKSETLLWVFPNVSYYKVHTSREFDGRYYLLSGRVTGDIVQDEATAYVDSGILGITTRHVYFGGGSERFRIGHDRIVAVEPYYGGGNVVHGVHIMRDSEGARLETFDLGDGAFAYELLRTIEAP